MTVGGDAGPAPRPSGAVAATAIELSLSGEPLGGGETRTISASIAPPAWHFDRSSGLTWIATESAVKGAPFQLVFALPTKAAGAVRLSTRPGNVDTVNRIYVYAPAVTESLILTARDVEVHLAEEGGDVLGVTVDGSYDAVPLDSSRPQTPRAVRVRTSFQARWGTQLPRGGKTPSHAARWRGTPGAPQVGRMSCTIDGAQRTLPIHRGDAGRAGAIVVAGRPQPDAPEELAVVIHGYGLDELGYPVELPLPEPEGQRIRVNRSVDASYSDAGGSRVGSASLRLDRWEPSTRRLVGAFSGKLSDPRSPGRTAILERCTFETVLDE